MTSKISKNEIGTDVDLRSNAHLDVKKKHRFIDIAQLFKSTVDITNKNETENSSLEDSRNISSTSAVLRLPFDEHSLFPDPKAYLKESSSIPEGYFCSICIPEVTFLSEDEGCRRGKHPGIIDLEKEYNNGFEPRVLPSKKKTKSGCLALKSKYLK